MDIKRKIVLILIIILILSGIILLCFPTISNMINTSIANKKSEEFDNKIENIQEGSFEEAYEEGIVDEEGYPIDKKGKRTSKKPYVFTKDINQLLEDVKAYNESLVFAQSDNIVEGVFEYAAIDLKEYGIFDNSFGYIEIPKIGLNLPIYLGANEYNFAYGIGHMNYTSLPISGENTNVSLAGHTGYAEQILFDNIRKLEVGDTVKIHNYWETLTYEVTEKKTIIPNDIQHLLITYGESKTTLVTCINNGRGGFDRYIVVCKLVTD